MTFTREHLAKVALSVSLLLPAACGGGGQAIAPAPANPNEAAPISAGAPAQSNGVPKGYTLTDLGTEAGGSAGMVPSAVNDDGVVIGLASGSILGSLRSCSSCGPVRAWVYRNGTLSLLRGLHSGDTVYADDINNGGDIVGGSAGASTENAVLWKADGTIVDLGTGNAPADSAAEATAINDSGRIAGYSYDFATGSPTLPAFFDGKGGSTDPCGAGIQGYFRSGLNDAGLGVGDELLSAGGTAAMTCPPFSAVVVPSNQQWLNFGFDVNDRGDVVGRMSPGPSIAIFHPFLYRDGKVTDLGSLFPQDSAAVGAAFAINQEGTIVGFSAAGGAVIGPPAQLPVTPRAFLYAGGRMVDLNTLLPASCANWTLVVAEDINNRGQIAASAYYGGYPNGIEHAVLLTPDR